MLTYHRTVTSALQATARLARASPYVALISAPVDKAEQIAERQLKRYPTIGVDHPTRTALRRAGIPAIQLVVMPPKGEEVTMLLWSNLPPPDSREKWQLALDPDLPLTWRNYQLSKAPKGAAITWRLSEAARAHYRQRLARLITGRGGIPVSGQQPYQLPDETAHAQVVKLAEHLKHYPGLSGIRADVFELAQHSTRLWKSTRPQMPYPAWPTMPYVRFGGPQTAPLSDLVHHQMQQEATDHDEAQEEASE